MNRIVYASPETIAEAAEGAFHKSDGLTIQEIAQYIGKTPRYAEYVAAAAMNLGVLTLKNDRYYITQEASDLAKANLDQRPIVFRKFLIRFDPFVIFAMLLLKGDTIEESARKVRVIFSVPDSLKDVINTLRSWGHYCGLIVRGNQVAGLDEDRLTEQYLEEFMRALQDEWHAKLFIAGKVREGAYAFLDETDKTHLVNSLRKYREYPDDSMKDVGNALENFLRKIATEKKVQNVSQQRGIGQLALLLRSSSERIILEEHRKMCDYVNIFRIAADHGSHPETLQSWKIEKDSALEAFLANLTTIRSIYSYISGGGQIL